MGVEDADAFWLIDQDPDVMHYLSGGKLTTKQDIDEIVIPRILSYRNESKGWGIWQVCDKNSQQYLGWILVRPMAFFTDNVNLDDIELGWRFFKNTWRKGYATEAAIAVTNAIANQTKAKFVSALAVEENIGSVGVMKKIGMAFINKSLHKDPLGDMVLVHYQMPVR